MTTPVKKLRQLVDLRKPGTASYCYVHVAGCYTRHPAVLASPMGGLRALNSGERSLPHIPTSLKWVP